MVLMKWVDAPIPLFRAKNIIEQASRRYLSPGADAMRRGVEVTDG
jgi:hypothetical protein